MNETTRVCSTCQEEKALSHFRPTNRLRCKECLSLAHKAWVKKNVKRNRQLCKASAEARRPKRDALIDSAKNRPCADCGLQFDAKAMDFDHLPGHEKHSKVSHFRRLGYSLKKIKDELDKCDVVCANCHRLRTVNRRLRKQEVSPDTIRYRRLQEWVNLSFKTGPCEACGGVFLPCQMDLDHINPSAKVDSVSELVRKRASYTRITNEANKCRLVCANCHRVRPS